ncbi:unnamed protein product [Cylicostephanus goldi]|uniref:Uncharacterized protein n=1 Tax=Cylicostephanus goldi TaxID=71465 RepID=A0A3P6RPK2_CYLGO|nr:unnamed protein product [Cylicostephanus goldi]
MVMDLTQSEASQENATVYHTIKPPTHNSWKTITNTVSMEISSEPISRSATDSPRSGDRDETRSLLQSVSTCRTQGDSSGSKTLQSAVANDRGDWRAMHIERFSASTFTSGEARDGKMDLEEEYDGVADESDLITNPMFKVEFAKSECNRSKRVAMSNVSKRKLMWKIRSNLWRTLSALPTAGVLGAGEHDQIEISIADNFDKGGKVEIAYVYVDDATEQFNRRIYSKFVGLQIRLTPHDIVDYSIKSFVLATAYKSCVRGSSVLYE